MIKDFYKTSNLTKKWVKTKIELNMSIVLSALESLENYQRVSKKNKVGEVVASLGDIENAIYNLWLGQISITRQQLRTALNKLEEEGYIKAIKKEERKTTTYFLGTFSDIQVDPDQVDLDEITEDNLIEELQDGSNTKNASEEIENQANKIWKAYPLKRGKVDALEHIKKHLKKYTCEEMLKAVELYIADIENQRKTKFGVMSYKNGDAFFEKRIFDYLDMEKEEIERVLKIGEKKSDVKCMTPEEKIALLEKL